MGNGMVGPWDKFTKHLVTLDERMLIAGDKSAKDGAFRIADQIREGITNQAPGGIPFQVLSQFTIDRKGCTKALLDSGDMRAAVTDSKLIQGMYFAGLLRTVMHKSGSGETSVVNIGRVHEFGIYIPVTDKMRGWFLAQGHPLRKSTVMIRIPARPFIAPVVKKELPKVQKGMRKAMADTLRF